MEQRSTSRWAAMAAAGGVALVLLVVVILLLSHESQPPTAIPVTTETVVAIVNGQPISRALWLEAAGVDGVMSRLAGVPEPTAEESLERLINGVLLLQELPQATPTAGEVEAYLGNLEASLGIGDEELVAALRDAGLERAALERTIGRLLMVQRAQQALQAQGVAVDDWLAQARERAEIQVNQEGLAASGLPTAAVVPSPPPSPPPTPTPLPPPAPDFALARADTGTFTLSTSLARGPVVVVFFQRCS
jgi:hypothetical protein